MSMSQSKEKTSDVGDAGLEIQTAYRTGMAASEPLGEGGTAWLQVLGAFCLNMNTW